MKQGCRTRCLAYLRKYAGKWIAKGTICDLARTHGGYTGEMTGRRLRELAESGEIEVKEIKGHAHYRWVEDKRKTLEDIRIRALEAFDALPG